MPEFGFLGFNLGFSFAARWQLLAFFFFVSCNNNALHAKLPLARFCVSLRSILHKTGRRFRSRELGVMFLQG